LADVGFGNLAPTCALLLHPGIEQQTPHEPMRFIDIGGELTLQAKLRDTWEHIYRVIPYPRYDDEYEITNWYTGTHPDAPYHGNIIAARPRSNRTRITIFNRRLTVRHATGEAERRCLNDEAEFRSVLRGEFGLRMSDEEIHACIDVMESRGEKGAPHPFFA
jgi:N-hydroxyarylamine O-acetyltransferase